MMTPYWLLIRNHPYPPVGVVWQDRRGVIRILRIVLPSPQETAEAKIRMLFPAGRPGVCPEITETANRIAAFLAGKAVRLSLTLAALDTCSPFQQQVLEKEYAVRRGRVTNYGRLALSLGCPGSARAVGNALARNPFPLLVPCHRAVRADGSLGGFQGGTAMKRKLLAAEGILFDAGGRVRPDCFQPPPT